MSCRINAASHGETWFAELVDQYYPVQKTAS